MKQDFYEILGVARDADDRTIKTAYRKLAMQYHPDRNPGDAAAEANFKLCAEAYEVLSSPEKRPVYDKYGHDGLRGGGGFSGADDIFAHFGDIFGDLFGGFSGRQSGGHSRARRGGDIKHVMDLAFREAIFGAKKKIEVTRHEACEACRGSGAKAGTKPETCRACGGRGQVVHGQGMFLIQQTCPECEGQGSVVREACVECRGAAYKKVRKEVEVEVPEGFANGMSLRYSGHGEPGANGGPSGDLYVVARVAEDETFVRDGDDLYIELQLNIAQAALGDTIKVQTIDGDEELRLPPGTQHGDKHTFRSRGVPNVRSGRRGDQIVVCNVEVPKELSAEQRELMEKLALSFTGKKPSGGKKRGLFR
jgi:molecular chaperone DnaJ